MVKHKKSAPVEQQATSLPGSLHIIQDVQHKPGMAKGISGIISSTTEGSQVRARLMMGVIDTLVPKKAPEGPVSHAEGRDSTAYNTGMVHLRGSPFTSHHH